MMSFMNSILIFFLSLFFLGKVQAATVTKINMEKKIVIIDEGTDTGFVKKAKVCFYDGSNKVGCGSVRASKQKIASIKPKPDKILEKIKEGMEARLESSGTGSPSAAPSTEGTTVNFSYIKTFSVFSALGGAKYSNVIYETPIPVGSEVETMWTKDKGAVTSLGGGLEYGLGFSAGTLAIGARAKYYKPKRIASDYLDRDNDRYFEQYVETLGTASSFGAYIGYYYLNKNWGLTGLRIGNGLDFDSSTINFITQQKEDNVEGITDIYKATSKLSALFLRTDILLDFSFGSFGFDFGLIALIPLIQKSDISSIEVNDPLTDASLLSTEAKNDLKSALGHEAKPGLDLTLGASYRF